MARVTKEQVYRTAFDKGITHLIKAQYPTGGWPPFWPPAKYYNRYISFNDGCMVEIMRLLQDVTDAKSFPLVRKDMSDAAQEAFNRGVACIVKAQIVEDNVLQGWCTRHDEKTLEPRPGKGDPVAVNGRETARILMLLMSIEDPDLPTIRAIHGGCAWLELVKLAAIRVDKTPTGLAVVRDPEAPLLWGHYYDIAKLRPLFTRRDGTIKYKLADLEQDRRSEIEWYGNWGQAVIERYEEWRDSIEE